MTVVLHNNLIYSNYSLKIDETRLICIALTKVDSRKPNPGPIKVSEDDFARGFNLSSRNIGRNIKNSLASISDKTLNIKSLNSDGKEELIKWFSMCNYHYSPNEGHTVELKFSDEISHYLFNLKKNFTQIKLKDIRKLTTPNSHKLYSLLAQQFIKRRSGLYEQGFYLKDMREIFHLPAESYPNWRDFKKRILQPAIDEINHNTNLSVNYEIKTRSNKVYFIQFYYYDESSPSINSSKPKRPRLIRRPKVHADTHKEESWKRHNFRLLSDYLINLKQWSPSAKLTMQDLDRIINYSSITNPCRHNEFKKERAERQHKSTFSKKAA